MSVFPDVAQSCIVQCPRKCETAEEAASWKENGEMEITNCSLINNFPEILSAVTFSSIYETLSVLLIKVIKNPWFGSVSIFHNINRLRSLFVFTLSLKAIFFTH